MLLGELSECLLLQLTYSEQRGQLCDTAAHHLKTENSWWIINCIIQQLLQGQRHVKQNTKIYFKKVREAFPAHWKHCVPDMKPLQEEQLKINVI